MNNIQQNKTDDINNFKSFSRIRILCFMTDDIVSFAAQKYGAEFFDYMDMTCGAVPDGEYEKVIDMTAPKQFLDLYTNIALNRYVLAYKKILELGDGYQKVLNDYFFNQGTLMPIEKPQNVQTAFNLINECVLEKSKVQNTITAQSENLIEWKKSDCDLSYWKFIKAFADGMISNTGITFTFSEDMTFSLVKKSSANL